MSPFYADHYPNNQECRWFIKPMEKTNYIRLRMKQLELASGDVLIIDKTIQITNNQPNRYRMVNKWITVCWPGCYFEFISDLQMTAMGFFFEIKPHARQSGKAKYLYDDK